MKIKGECGGRVYVKLMKGQVWGCFGDMQVIYVDGMEVGNGVLLLDGFHHFGWILP